MSQDPQQKSERTELPIERGFPIERVNEIAAKEGRGIAKQYYRPIYTMHKWWARRLGCVFRAISLYTLADNPDEIRVFEPGENTSLSDYGNDTQEISQLLEDIDMTDPEALWPLYKKDTRISNKKVFDPFSGGGTSLVESSRFGVSASGLDLNPVAWFVTKKELDAHQVEPSDLEDAYQRLEEKVAEELKQYYKTTCSTCDSEADVMCYFWVKELDCVSCGESVPLFDDYRVAKGRYENKGKYNVFCPDCSSVVHVDDWRTESICENCGFSFEPSEGNTASGSRNYSCGACGQKYRITDAIQEQGGFNLRLYALEYYCPTCDQHGRENGEIKAYKGVSDEDRELYKEAQEEWKNSDLNNYVPTSDIPKGSKTQSSSIDGSDVFKHGYETWDDLYNERQLLTLGKLLRAIDSFEDDMVREFLLLSFSDALRGNTMLLNYQIGGNAITNLFKSNSFDPPKRPAENNPWGAEEGARNFQKSFDRMIKGVEYASKPFDRYKEDGEMIKSPPFGQPVGVDAEVAQGNVLEIDKEDEFDAVITDPPYYDNIIYSELSNYFYVWLRQSLSDDYECFEPEYTPRSESIVANPAEEKGEKEFEDEIRAAFSKIHKALKEDGALVFTYHHSDSESWGELLQALCDVEFEITATYPVTADIDKLVEGESVSFDIIVVARPARKREAKSWNSLRRDIYRTARRTRKQLEENRDLSRGDIGVMEMGACFREYSKHHGKVQQDGEIMSAKEVVQEIYGIIQEASDIGVEDVFIDLLDSNNPSFDDVNKLCRGTNATPEDLKEMRLYNQDEGFELGTWDNEKRQAYIQERINGDSDDHLSNLDKLQFLRYRYEKGQSVQNYVEKWEIDDDLRELAGRLADVTGDDTYTRVLGDRDITSY